MTYMDEYQENIRLDSASDVEKSYRMLCAGIAEREGVAEELANPLSMEEKQYKLKELERLCGRSEDSPFIVDLKHKKFTKTGFRYFAVAFYAHIYHAFIDVVFGIALSAPPSAALRRTLVDNLWDEFGVGEQNNAHLRIYEDSVLSYLELVPLSESEMQWVGSGGDSEACLFNVKFGVERNAMLTAQMWSEVGKLPFRAALSATVFGSECASRYVFPPIVDCIKRSGIPDDVSKYFRLHIGCDEHHYNDLKAAFIQFINTRQDIIEAEAGLRIMLGIRGKFCEHLKSKDLLENP